MLHVSDRRRRGDFWRQTLLYAHTPNIVCYLWFFAIIFSFVRYLCLEITFLYNLTVDLFLYSMIEQL